MPDVFYRVLNKDDDDDTSYMAAPPSPLPGGFSPCDDEHFRQDKR